MPARLVPALVALLALTGCSGGVEGDPSPAPRTFTEPLASVDLDAVAPTGVDVLDLAADPDGTLALLADTADPAVTYLAEVGEDGLGEVRRLGNAGDQLFLAPDGTVLVVGAALTRIAPGQEPTVTALDVGGTVAALSPDGRRLYLATDDGRLVAVDAATGRVEAGTDLDEGLSVRALAAGEDGVTGLLSDARAPDLADVAVLGTWDGDLQQTGTVELAPDQPASTPSALRLADDGTAVVTLTAGGDDPFRVVTVDGEEVTSHPIPGTDRTPADLAVSPDGRVAYLPVVGFEVQAGVVTLDLASGELTAEVGVCPGQGAFGPVAMAGDRLTVVGSCTTSEAPSSTAFVLG